MTNMLISAAFVERIRERMRAGTVAYTTEMRQTFAAQASTRSGAERVMSVAGDRAEIQISGVLVDHPDILLWLMGFEMTSYEDIRTALAVADADPSVRQIVLKIDSPGGSVDGCFETIQALNAVSKPLTAVASFACSAAYALAAQAGKIRAVTPASTFGSVGVVRTYYADGPAAQELSIDVTSAAAPNKRPNVMTGEGKGVITAELNAIHDLLVDAIASGRKVNAAKVNAEFGRGGTMLAGAARRAGMIDSILPAPSAKASATADPRTDLAAYLSQRHRPFAGESETEFAERTVQLWGEVRAIRARGGSRADYDALFDDGTDPSPARNTSRGGSLIELFENDLRTSRGNPNEPGDLGDQVAARMLARRGKAPATADSDLAELFASDLQPRRANPNERRDLRDVVADAMGLPPDPGPR